MFKVTSSTLILVLAAIAVLPSVVFGQVDGPDYWWVNDADLGNNGFRGICALSETNIWVVGEYGVVYNRSGIIHAPVWTSKSPAGYQYYDFNDVCFVDASHGWIVGEKRQTLYPYDPASYSGVVLYTTDGGTSWNLPTSMPTFLIPTPFRKVKIVQVGDLYYGYISCGNGAVLITRNGGATWSRTQTDPWSDPANISNWYNGLWVDSTDLRVNRVWISGDAFGIIAKTEDGGNSWTAYQPTAFNQTYSIPGNPQQPLKSPTN
jgi:photosystem II stability/assembly factor-like uncharacterized protein